MTGTVMLRTVGFSTAAVCALVAVPGVSRKPVPGDAYRELLAEELRRHREARGCGLRDVGPVSKPLVVEGDARRGIPGSGIGGDRAADLRDASGPHVDRRRGGVRDRLEEVPQQATRRRRGRSQRVRRSGQVHADESGRGVRTLRVSSRRWRQSATTDARRKCVRAQQNGPTWAVRKSSAPTRFTRVLEWHWVQTVKSGGCGRSCCTDRVPSSLV